MQKQSLFLIFLISLLGLNAATAQTTQESINLQGYYFSDSYRYSILDDSGILRFPRPFVFTTSLAYVNTPLVLADANSENKEKDFLDHFIIGTLGATYYFNSIFSFGADLSYVQTTYSDEQPQGYGYENNRGNTYGAIGDMTLRAKLRLYRDVVEKIGLALMLRADLGTGSPEGFTTDDSTRLTANLIFEKYWQRFSFLLGAGYSVSDSARYVDIDYRTLLPFTLGVSFRMNDVWNINTEVVRNFALKGGNKQDAGDYYVTLKGKVFKYASFYTGGGIAGISDVDQDNWTLFAGLKLHEDDSAPAPAPKEKEPEFDTPAPILERAFVQPPPVIVKREQEKLLGDLFKADRAYFDNGKSNIKKSEIKKLDDVADYLIGHEDEVTKVIIEGYASKVGPKKVNAVLSAERAENVYQYLVRKGVPRKMLQTVSYGDDYLNEEPEHWMNRRVEFRIYKKRQSAPAAE